MLFTMNKYYCYGSLDSYYYYINLLLLYKFIGKIKLFFKFFLDIWNIYDCFTEHLAAYTLLVQRQLFVDPDRKTANEETTWREI